MKRFMLFAWLTMAASGLIMGQESWPGGDFKQIVGGEDSEGDEEFPFVAKIHYGGSYVGCTGSLIAPDKVLTAGHCMKGYKTKDLQVGFGVTRLEGPRYRVTRRIFLDEWSAQLGDVGVLQLESDITGIQPVRVLTLEEELLYAPSGSRRVVAVGWGRTAPKAGGPFPTERLQKLEDIPIYTHEDCRSVIEELRSQGKAPGPPSIHERVLCAGEEGRAIGAGDSGGPLLVDTPQGWGLIGVLAQATHDDFLNVIYMGQWTRTSYYLDFIFPTYTLHFAHSAVGGGWTTDLVLLNTNRRKTVEATVEVFSSDGRPRIRELISLQSMAVEEWLPAGGEQIETGGVVVSSPEKLSGFLRFRHEEGAATSVQDAPVADAFMLPVSSRVDRVGLAVFNVDDEDLTVVLRVGNRALHVTIPAQAKTASFVDELFPAHRVSGDALTVRTDPPGGQITVLALEMVGGSLVTIPAVVLD